MEITAKIILLTAIKITIVLLMVSLGMETTRQALLQLWRRSWLLVGSLVAAFVVVPVITYGIFQILPLPIGTKAGLFAISITPGAPMVYRAAMKRGIGNPELAVSFQVTVALLVIILAPIWLEIISALTGSNYGIPFSVLLKQVSTIQLIPLLIGMVLHRWLPDLVECVTPIVMKMSQIALYVLVVILLAVLGLKIIAGIHVWTILAAVLMAASAIIGGHLLAGPEAANRLTIANANAQRNPGLALTITAWTLSQQQGNATVAMVVYLITSIVMIAVYTNIYGKLANLRAT